MTIGHRVCRTCLSLGIVLAALCSCGPDVLERIDKPITLAEARRKKETFPFPESAQNIYWGVYQNIQEYEYIVRFEAPSSDCLATVPNITAWYEQKHHPHISFTSVPLGPNTSLPKSDGLYPVPWFDLRHIQRGVQFTGDSQEKPNIWIDLERGIFYFRDTD